MHQQALKQKSTCTEKTAGELTFPIEVSSDGEGWFIILRDKQQIGAYMLGPGWLHDTRTGIGAPYIFASAAEAWTFLKNLYLLCSRQKKLLSAPSGSIRNCNHCGCPYRAYRHPFCLECIGQYSHLLEQLHAMMYHQTGSRQAALDSLTMMLKRPKDEVKDQLDQIRSDAVKLLPSPKKTIRAIEAPYQLIADLAS